MPYEEINGQRYFYVDTETDGGAVFFLHGMNMDHEMFAPQIEALRDDYRCIAWDERGHGSTEEDGMPWDLWDLAADGVELLSRLGVDQAVWVGMSQGGMMTMRAALSRPEVVRAMVLIDTTATAQDPAMLPFLDEIFDDWCENGPAKHAGTIADLLVGSSEISASWRQKWDEWDPKRMRHVCDAVFGRDDIHTRLAEISCPAMVIHGTADVGMPVEIGEQLSAWLPGSIGCVKIEGGTHAPNLTHPAEVNAAIADFLRHLPEQV